MSSGCARNCEVSSSCCVVSCDVWFFSVKVSVILSCFRGVAQPGSVPAWGAGGRRFKSSRPDQNKPA